MNMTRSIIPNLHDVAFHNAAHEVFSELRARSAVARGKSGRRDIWLITRHAEVIEALSGGALIKDPANVRSRRRVRRLVPLPPGFSWLFESMITSDDPAHRRLRREVSRAFTPRALQSFIESLRPEAEALIASAAALAEPFDFVREVALPLPVLAIARLVGVPSQDRERFGRIVSAIVRAPSLRAMPGMLLGLRRFSAYIRELLATKRREPGEDLLSKLVTPSLDQEEEALSEEELIAMAFLLLVAGYETTVGLISNGMLALLSHPEQMGALKQDRALMPNAIEEMLRYDGPLLATDPYYARQTFEIQGEVIPAGGVVFPALLSANRDERAFDRAGDFDVRRDPATMRHLAFGRGMHFCLGAQLARAEASLVFSALLDLEVELELAVDRARIRYGALSFLHRLEAMPVIARRSSAR